MCTHGRSDPWVDWEKGTKILFVKFCFGDRSSFRTGNGGESKNISVIFGCCDFLLVVIMIKARQNDAERERRMMGMSFPAAWVRVYVTTCLSSFIFWISTNYLTGNPKNGGKIGKALCELRVVWFIKKTTLVGFFDGRTKRCEMIRVRLFTCPLADWDFPPLVWGCD